MKKIICMAIALVMAALLLVACGPAAEDSTPAPTVPTHSSSGSVTGGLGDNIFDNTEPTQPTESSSVPTQPSQGATVPSTVPSQGETQPSTQPTTPTNAPDPEPFDPSNVDYETFQAMTGAEQRAFQESFEDIAAFFEWYTATKEAYEQANPPIEIGPDGSVELG